MKAVLGFNYIVTKKVETLHARGNGEFIRLKERKDILILLTKELISNLKIKICNLLKYYLMK